ncbi:MAG: MJ1477/TM1410 family putative glycoside hydrolase [Hyphomicrobiaceae bacterium]
MVSKRIRANIRAAGLWMSGWRVAGFGLAASLAVCAGSANAADNVVQGIEIKSWGYQLQNDETTVIAKSPYDLVVIDYQRDPSLGGPFKPAELAQMKKKPDGSRRFVIAYISIGEAENYRYYWGDRNWGDVRNRTPLIEKENPEWEGNLNVKYWEQEWQNLILNDADSYINRIMDAGFDGIYLDKVDIVDDYQGKTPAGTVASDLMIQFVRKISTVTKIRNPNFLTIAQNAEGLLDDDVYRMAIDGIGKESLLYTQGFFDPTVTFKEPTRNDAASIKESTRLLSKLRADKKLVLCVEYINKPTLIQKAATELGGNGFVAYFGPRDLTYLSYTEVATK